MIKSIALIRRKPGLTHEEFRCHYEEVHAPLALTCLPGLRKYVRNYVVGEVFGAPADFDVVSEFWYESADDIKASLAFYHSPAGQVLRDDELLFMDKESIRACRVVEHGGEVL